MSVDPATKTRFIAVLNVDLLFRRLPIGDGRVDTAQVLKAVLRIELDQKNADWKKIKKTWLMTLQYQTFLS